ncbi:hypothetical protein MIR68_008555 [Amoeboaphelidium protococcarum]|nr:hypothetical protein MIR68_008555 [Amoeboaphelidium protococcarum]
MGLAQPKQRKDKPVVGDIRNLNNHWKDSVAPLSPAYKMLQKMGWKDGKGLGRNEEGHTEHIKIKLKTDATGIGSHELPRSEDNWLAHTDAFNDILSQLNVQIAPDSADSKINVSDSEVVVDSTAASTPAFGRLAHRAKFLKAKQEATSDTSNHIHIFGQSSTSVSVNQTVVNQVSETQVCEDNDVITEKNHKKKEKSKKSKSSKKDNKISKKLKKSKKERAHKCEQS